MVGNLKKSDRIMINSGIYGRITSLDEATVTVEIADKVSVKVNRAYVAALAQPSQAQPEKKDSGKLKSK